MLVLKKNLRVSERFPYPVRVEAVLELIDQLPVRKLEKMTRKSSNLRFTHTVVSFTLLTDRGANKGAILSRACDTLVQNISTNIG